MLFSDYSAVKQEQIVFMLKIMNAENQEQAPGLLIAHGQSTGIINRFTNQRGHKTTQKLSNIFNNNLSEK